MSKDIWARFVAKIDVRSPEECWPWIPNPNPKGYGDARIATVNNVSYRIMAHRAALMLSGVDVKRTEVVDHICRNKRCCNPAHLRAVSPTVNALENSLSPAAINAARTHCKHGHPLSDDRDQYGKRRCDVCCKIRYNAWYHSEDGQRYHIDKYHRKHGYKTDLVRKTSAQRRFLTAFGETKALCEWARQFDRGAPTILNRINRGWSHEDAISRPAKHNKRWHGAA